MRISRPIPRRAWRTDFRKDGWSLRAISARARNGRRPAGILSGPERQFARKAGSNKSSRSRRADRRGPARQLRCQILAARELGEFALARDQFLERARLDDLSAFEHENT